MKLALVKGLSYSTFKFNAVKGVPVEVEDEEQAKMLLKTGRFEEIVEVSEEEAENPDEEEEDDGSNKEGAEKPLSKMRTDELQEYADGHGIDISACTTNKDRVAAIEEALKKAAEEEAKNPDENQNGVVVTPGFDE